MKAFRLLTSLILAALLWFGGGISMQALAGVIPEFTLTNMEPSNAVVDRKYHDKIFFVPNFNYTGSDAYVFECTYAKGGGSDTKVSFIVIDEETGDQLMCDENQQITRQTIYDGEEANYRATFHLQAGHKYSVSILNPHLDTDSPARLTLKVYRPTGVTGESRDTRALADNADVISAETNHHSIDLPALYTEVYPNHPEDDFHTYSWYKFTPVKQGWHTVYVNSFSLIHGTVLTEQNGTITQLDADQHTDLGGSKEYYHRFWGEPGHTYYFLLSEHEGQSLWNVGLDVVHEQDLPRHLFDIAYPSRKGNFEEGPKYFTNYPLAATRLPQESEGGLNGSYRGMLWEEFVPTVSSDYYFQTITSSQSNHDTYAELYELRGNLYGNHYLQEIARNDDGGIGHNPQDFSLSAFLIAGHTYYLAVRDYDERYYKSGGNEIDLAVTMSDDNKASMYRTYINEAEELYEGSNRKSVRIQPIDSQYLIDYTWHKFTPVYTDNYVVTTGFPPNSDEGGGIECIILDDALDVIADVSTLEGEGPAITAVDMTKGTTYYILLRNKRQGFRGEASVKIVIDCPLYTKDYKIAMNMDSAETLSVGNNSVSFVDSWTADDGDIFSSGTYIKFTAPYTDYYKIRMPNMAKYGFQGHVLNSIYEGYYTHFVGSEVAFGVGISNELQALSAAQSVDDDVLFTLESEEQSYYLEKGQTLFIVLRRDNGQPLGKVSTQVISLGADMAQDARLLTLGDNVINLKPVAHTDTKALSAFNIYRIVPEYTYQYTFSTSVGNLGVGQGFQGMLLDDAFQEVSSFMPLTEQDLAISAPVQAGKTYYLLLRNHAGINHSDLHLNVSFADSPDYVAALTAKEQNAIPITEGQVTAFDIAASQGLAADLTDYTWLKLTAAYDSHYQVSFSAGGAMIEGIVLDEGLQKVSQLETPSTSSGQAESPQGTAITMGTTLAVGGVRYFLVRTVDGSPLTDAHVSILCPAYQEHRRELAIEERRLAAKPVSMGWNTISLDAVSMIEHDLPYQHEFIWFKFDAPYDDEYTIYAETDQEVELGVIYFNQRALLKKMPGSTTYLTDETNYILLRTADGSALSNFKIFIDCPAAYAKAVSDKAKASTYTVKEGSNNISVSSVDATLKHRPLLQYTWRKFVPQYDDIYTFGKAAGTELKVLDAEFKEVASDAVLVKDATYYVLYRMADGTAKSSVSLTIDCAAYQQQLADAEAAAYAQAVADRARTTTYTVKEGSNSVSVLSVNASLAHRPLLQYTWRKFVPQHDDVYTFGKAADTELKVLDAEFNEVASDAVLAKDATYYVLYRMADGSAKSSVSLTINCPTYQQFLADAEATAYAQAVADRASATTSKVKEGENTSFYGYVVSSATRPLLDYFWRKFVPQFSDAYTFTLSGENKDKIEFLVLDAELNEVEDYNLTAGATYYVLGKTTATANRSATLKITSLKYQASIATAIAEGRSSLAIAAVDPAYDSQPLLQWTWRKFVPKFSDKYSTAMGNSCEWKVIDSEFNAFEDMNLTAGETYYVLCRMKDGSQSTNSYYLWVNCPKNLASTTTKTIGYTYNNSIDIAAVNQYYQDSPLLTYTWSKIEAKYTDVHQFNPAAGTEYLVLDTDLNVMDTYAFTEGETYYFLYRMADGTAKTGAKVTMDCPKGYYARTVYFAENVASLIKEGTNTVNIKAVDPDPSFRPLLQYSWFKLIPVNTDEYTFTGAANTQIKVLDAEFNELSEYNLTAGETYYVLYTHNDAQAHSGVSLVVYSSQYEESQYHAALVKKAASITKTLKEGENYLYAYVVKSATRPLLDYCWHKFVPQFSDAYTFTLSGTSKDKIEFLVLDAEYNVVEDYNLTAGATYYVLGKTSDTNYQLGSLTIDCPQHQETLYAKALDDKAMNAWSIQPGQEKDVNTYNYDPTSDDQSLLTYSWGRFTASFPGAYSIAVGEDYEYIVIDDSYQTVDVADIVTGNSYYVLVRHKDGYSGTSTLTVLNYAALLHSKFQEHEPLYMEGSQTWPVRYESYLEDYPLALYTWGWFIAPEEEHIYKLPEHGVIYQFVKAPAEGDHIDPENYEVVDVNDLVPGEEYILMVREDGPYSGDIPVHVMPKSALDAPVLTLGENTISANATSTTWYRFTPEATGSYRIVYNPYDEFYYAFDSWEGGLLFADCVQLTGGKEYYVLFRTGEATGSVDNYTIRLESLVRKHVTPKMMDESTLLALRDLPQDVADAVGRYKAEGQSYEIYAISTAEEMEGFRDLANERVETNIIGVLMRDIKMNNIAFVNSGGTVYYDNGGFPAAYQWEPICRMSDESVPAGDFYLVGQRHVIEGLCVNTETAGLCSEIYNLHAHDVFMQQSNITGVGYAATFAGKAYDSSFDGCLANSWIPVSAYYMSAGFVGQAHNVSFTNCQSMMDTGSGYFQNHILNMFAGEYYVDPGHRVKAQRLFASPHNTSGKVIYAFAYSTHGDASDIDAANNHVDIGSSSPYNHHYFMDSFSFFNGTVSNLGLEAAYQLQGDQERHYWGMDDTGMLPMLGNMPVRYEEPRGYYVTNGYGDYNGDGVVNVGDVTTLQGMILGTESPTYRDARIVRHYTGNFYGDYSVTDVAVLTQYLKDGIMCMNVPTLVPLDGHIWTQLRVFTPQGELYDYELTSSDPEALVIGYDPREGLCTLEGKAMGRYELTVRPTVTDDAPQTFSVYVAPPRYRCPECSNRISVPENDPLTPITHCDACGHDGEDFIPMSY